MLHVCALVGKREEIPADLQVIRKLLFDSSNEQLEEWLSTDKMLNRREILLEVANTKSTVFPLSSPSTNALTSPQRQ
jgi:ATP-dependent protease HslVU (ClpYQ) peptidase subunit